MTWNSQSYSRYSGLVIGFFSGERDEHRSRQPDEQSDVSAVLRKFGLLNHAAHRIALGAVSMPELRMALIVSG